MNSALSVAFDRGKIRTELNSFVAHWRPRIDEWKATNKNTPRNLTPNSSGLIFSAASESSPNALTCLNATLPAPLQAGAGISTCSGQVWCSAKPSHSALISPKRSTKHWTTSPAAPLASTSGRSSSSSPTPRMR